MARRQNAALKKQRRGVGKHAADAQHQIRPGAQLGQRGGVAAAVLQRALGLGQRRAGGAVADGASGLGQPVQRPGAGHIGAQAAQQRLPAGAQDVGRCLQRRVQRARLAVDGGAGPGGLRQQAAQAPGGTGAVGADQARWRVGGRRSGRPGGQRNPEVLTQQRAERADPGPGRRCGPGGCGGGGGHAGGGRKRCAIDCRRALASAGAPQRQPLTALTATQGPSPAPAMAGQKRHTVWRFRRRRLGGGWRGSGWPAALRRRPKPTGTPGQRRWHES